MELLEQVSEIVYLGSIFTRDSKYMQDVERRVCARNRVNGALRSLIGSHSLNTKAKLCSDYNATVRKQNLGMPKDARKYDKCSRDEVVASYVLLESQSQQCSA